MPVWVVGEGVASSRRLESTGINNTETQCVWTVL